MRSHQSSDLSWQAQVRPVLEDIRAARGVPGFVVAVQQRRQTPDYLVMGIDGAGQALTVDTLFPVASITKLATTPTVLRLVATGALDLDSPLATVLPDAAASAEPITPRLLLCHIAGLPVDLLPWSQSTPPFGARWPSRRLGW